LNVSFTPAAEADLDAIYDYLAEHDDQTAAKVIARILQAIAYLESFPLLGRPGRIAGTRELSIVCLAYYAVYRIVDATQLDVIAIMHERQQYP
jgi:toxin ParE1/3/4